MPPPPAPRRVLILNHNLRYHGTYFRALEVGRRLARRGHVVTLVTTGPGYYRARKEQLGNLTIWESPSGFSPALTSPDDGWSPLGLLWRLGLAVFQRWDVVYAFSHKPVDAWPARWARRLRGSAWIADWCDLYGGPGIHAMRRAGREKVHALQDRVEAWDGRLEEATARDCDFLTVISADLLSRAEELGRGEEALHLLRNGANLDGISPQDRRDCRARLGLAHITAPLLGYIANYHPDQDLLLDAVGRAARENREAQFIVAGNPLYDQDKALDKHGLTDRTLILGRISDEVLPWFFGACDVLLLPLSDTPFNRSRFPYKATDYLAAGRPQVACAVGDVPAVLGGAPEVAALCEPTAEAFAAAALALLDDPPRRQSTGENARRRAEDRFAWNALVQSLLTAYNGTRTRDRHRL